MKQLISLTLGLYIVFFYTTPLAYAVGSFGITPPYVINQNLEPGSVHEQIVYIVRRDASKEIMVEIVSNVPGADSWFEIDAGNSFPIPAGENKYPINVTVTVPDEVSAGTYTGVLQVAVRAIEGEGDSGMISVGLRARARVDLNVLYDGVGAQQGNRQTATALFSGVIIGWIVTLAVLLMLIFLIFYSRRKFKKFKKI